MNESWKIRIVGEGEADPNSLLLNPLNWRTHPKHQQEALAGMLGKVGWVQRVIVNKTTGNIVDGHARVMIARKRKEQCVPVIYVDLSIEEEKMVLATLDPLSAMATSDDDMLKNLVSQLNAQDNMNDGVLRAILGGESKPSEKSERSKGRELRLEELQKKWDVKIGQIWSIVGQSGEHRVGCGNSNDVLFVDKLMDGVRASTVVFDPDYEQWVNVLSSSSTKKRREKSFESDMFAQTVWEKIVESLQSFKSMVMTEDSTLFVFSPPGEDLFNTMQSITQAGFPLRHMIIWVKNTASFTMNRMDYDYKHEPILMTWGSKHQGHRQGLWKTSIWECDKVAKTTHPHEKPLDLYRNMIVNHSGRGEFVADLQAGSGPCLIAAEMEGRIARVADISPVYVAGIIERAEIHGMKPRLLH